MAYSSLRTRNTSGLHPSLRGLRGLGAAVAMTATQAIQQALSMYSGEHLNTSSSIGAAWMSLAESEISAGQFDMSVWASTCSGQTPAPNLNLLKTGSGLALSAATATTGILASSSVALIPAAAVPVVGWVVAGVGAVIGLIDSIFQHHAQAVARDNTFSCSALPAVNNAFNVIAQAVQAGTMNASDAAAALPEIYTQFMQAGGANGSISGPSNVPSGGTAINNSPYCNSNCEMSIVLLGMILYWQAQYQGIAAQQATEAQQAAAVSANSGVSTLTPATPTPSSSMVVPAATSAAPAPSGLASIPAWGWIAMALFGAWMVA